MVSTGNGEFDKLASLSGNRPKEVSYRTGQPEGRRGLSGAAEVEFLARPDEMAPEMCRA